MAGALRPERLGSARRGGAPPAHTHPHGSIARMPAVFSCFEPRWRYACVKCIMSQAVGTTPFHLIKSFGLLPAQGVAPH